VPEGESLATLAAPFGHHPGREDQAEHAGKKNEHQHGQADADHGDVGFSGG
jgi:hypothetical protein